jgi:hypothetical protein
MQSSHIILNKVYSLQRQVVSDGILSARRNVTPISALFCWFDCGLGVTYTLWNTERLDLTVFLLRDTAILQCHTRFHMYFGRPIAIWV